MPNQTKLITIIGLVVIVAAIAVGVTLSAGKTKTAVTMPTSSARATATASTAVTAASPAANTTSEYKDGTYTATGSYTSPGGQQAITVEITLAGDKVTTTSATSGATDSQSSEYQSDFIDGYKSLVVGKSLDSLSLSRVSGSSLTSTGFNNAIAAIKQQAKAS